MNILIVDDEPILIDSLELGLKKYGYRIIKCNNGKSALDYLDRNPDTVNLVITDYAMPGMNGLELLKEIRNRFGNLPVIMMTAHGEKEIVVEALKHRCDSFIEKSFTLDELVTEIDRAKLAILQNTRTSQLKETTRKLIHQINNPLMSIAGFAELSKEMLNDPTMLEENLDQILKATEKINIINREILKADQLKTNTGDTVDANEVLTACVNGFTGLMVLKDIQIKIAQNESPLMIFTNKFNLEQIFCNLILNAIDAMDGMPVKILTVSSCITNGPMGQIRIQDTGCGIPQSNINKIFNTGFTDKHAKGTGLGLSVVKEMVKGLNGVVTVSSDEKNGTTFTLNLPLAKQTA